MSTKRKFTPFPSISSNTNKVCNISDVQINSDTTTNNNNKSNMYEDDNNASDSYIDYELNKTIIMNKAIIKKNDLKILQSYLPENHEYSIQLTDELLSLQNNLPHGIENVYLISKGILEIILNIGNLGNPLGYGCHRWYCHIGGASGIVMSHMEVVPITIRFLEANSFAHVMVDDTGCVDDTFWLHLPCNKPSLFNILQQLVKMLLKPLTNHTMKDNDEINNYHIKWYLAEQHTYNKIINIKRYKELQLHSTLFTHLNDDYLHPTFKLLINLFETSLLDGTCRDENALWKKYINQNSPGVYSFDLFSNEYCMKLIEEVENYERSNLMKRRPNTMNNYGLILNEIGMYEIMSKLMSKYIEPIVNILYEHEPVAYGLDHHHTFIVQYDAKNVKGDLGLDMHHDSSEITLNVCLGKEGFRGGKLKFCGEAGSSNYRKFQYQYQHVIGRAVIHLGRHRHGADDLIVNEHNRHHITIDSINSNSNPNNDDDNDSCNQRINLIMWLRSSIFRSMAAYGVIYADGYPKDLEHHHNITPDLCCLSRFNDDDYDLQKQRYQRI